MAEMKQVLVRLSERTYWNLKTKATKEQKTLQEALHELIDSYIKTDSTRD